jgi:hypothetical protein
LPIKPPAQHGFLICRGFRSFTGILVHITTSPHQRVGGYGGCGLRAPLGVCIPSNRD